MLMWVIPGLSKNPWSLYEMRESPVQHLLAISGKFSRIKWFAMWGNVFVCLTIETGSCYTAQAHEISNSYLSLLHTWAMRLQMCAPAWDFSKCSCANLLQVFEYYSSCFISKKLVQQVACISFYVPYHAAKYVLKEFVIVLFFKRST